MKQLDREDRIVLMMAAVVLALAFLVGLAVEWLSSVWYLAVELLTAAVAG